MARRSRSTRCSSSTPLRQMSRRLDESDEVSVGVLHNSDPFAAADILDCLVHRRAGADQ